MSERMGGYGGESKGAAVGDRGGVEDSDAVAASDRPPPPPRQGGGPTGGSAPKEACASAYQEVGRKTPSEPKGPRIDYRRAPEGPVAYRN